MSVQSPSQLLLEWGARGWQGTPVRTSSIPRIRHRHWEECGREQNGEQHGSASSKLRASGSEGLSAMEGRVERYVCACTGVVGKPPEWAVVSEVSGAGPGEGVAQSGGCI